MNSELQTGPGKSERDHLVPAHILYPGAVLVLLVAGMAGAAAVFWASRSDGGVSIVDDYYRKAVEWDARVEVERQSRLLGWSVQMRPVTRGGVRGVRFEILDSAGQPVSNISGTVNARRADSERPSVQVPIAPSDDDDTAAREVLLPRPGVWYFDFDVTRGTEHFVTTVRREIRG